MESRFAIRLVEPITLDIEATVPPGIQSIGLIGPSGVGKTTLLRALVGLAPTTKMEIEINGNRIHLDQPVHLNSVGLVQQHPVLFPHWSVEQHIYEVTTNRKKQTKDKPTNSFNEKPSNQVKLDPNLLIENLGIKPLLQHKPKELSGGQKQRVAILLALLAEPQVLLLDEAFSALDEVNKKILFPVINDAIKQLNCFTFIVSHQNNDLMALCQWCWDLRLPVTESNSQKSDILQVVQHTEQKAVQLNFNGPIRQGIRQYLGRHAKLNYLNARLSQSLPKQIPTDDALEYVIGEDLVYLQPHGLKVLSPEEAYLTIASDEIGIARKQLDNTSFNNILPATINHIGKMDDGYLIESHLRDAQVINAQITRRSLEKLDLNIGDSIYLIFKANAMDLIPIPTN